MDDHDAPRPAGARHSESLPRIPEALWKRFVARHGGGIHIVDVRLSDGAEYRDVAVDERGRIAGEDVGLWDGVRPFDPPIPAERIAAIKERSGVIGYLGLCPWVRSS
jgi:hypothetical protein